MKVMAVHEHGFAIARIPFLKQKKSIHAVLHMDAPICK